VINRIKVARYAVVGGAVLALGAAAGAATKMKRWSAGDACLCTPDSQPAAPFAAVGAAATGATASHAHGNGMISPSLTSGGAGPLAPYLAASGASFWNMRAALASRGNAGSVGWFGKTGNVGAYSASSSHHVAALGGLWRLMSFNKRAPQAVKQLLARHESKPSRGSSGGGSNHKPSAPGAGPAPAGPALPPLFGYLPPSIADLLGCGGGNIPGLGGSVGAGGGLSGSGLATTPEPGSIFLLGTGVLGLFGMLRRRAMQ
jgi:hypothetical protein